MDAVEYAGQHGLHTVGLLGFDGGALLETVDVAIFTESRSGAYGPVESVHVVAGDIITTCLIEDGISGAGSRG